jgi:hypothetical protein
MALTLQDVRCDPVADRALKELMRRYAVAEGGSGLVLTAKAGDMKLFVNKLDDLHQWYFVYVQKLRASWRKTYEERESWKRRALLAETKVVEAAASPRSGQVVSDWKSRLRNHGHQQENHRGRLQGRRPEHSRCRRRCQTVRHVATDRVPAHLALSSSGKLSLRRDGISSMSGVKSVTTRTELLIFCESPSKYSDQLKVSHRRSRAFHFDGTKVFRSKSALAGDPAISGLLVNNFFK